MHPQISQCPNALFYRGQLLDAPSLPLDLPYYENQILGPYAFIDVEGREIHLGTSKYNVKEVDIRLLGDSTNEISP